MSFITCSPAYPCPKPWQIVGRPGQLETRPACFKQLQTVVIALH
jgi:hypothetical protein